MSKLAKLTVALVTAALLASIPAVVSGQMSDEPFARNPAQDFVFPPGDDDPQDLWSDGTTLWVSDTSAGKIFAYNLENREQEIGNNFETLSAEGNDHPTGIWSDETTMWVADAIDQKIYAYRMDTKERDAENDFDTLIGAGNESPGGLWSDGTTLWVVDTGDSTIYAYDLDSTDHIAGGGIEVREYYKWPSDVNIRQLSPFGIWSNNTTLWVSMWVAGSDAFFSKIAAYDMTTKARDSGKDIAILSAAGNHNPRGIWSDDATMWVVDWHDGKVYAYDLETRERQAEKDVYSLNAIGGNNPRDLWSDGTTAWVADYSDEKIYAYNLETMKREPRKDLNNLVPPSGRDPPRGIWSDGTTMWVAYWGYTSGATNAFRDYPSLHGYQMYADVPGTSGTFSNLYDFYNDHPSGMWSNGTTMWVADSSDDKLYAYELETRYRDSDKDFNTLDPAGNESPQGIWSDTATMWVADSSDGKIYAYDMDGGKRDANKDFNTLRDAGNSYPLGIWSDGRTMWVVDGHDLRIYAYNMPPGTRLPQTTTPPGNSTIRPITTTEDPEPPPPSAVKAQCITGTASEDSDSETGHINLGETITDRWSRGCPSVTRGGRMAKYYTFSLPHTTAVKIALKSHLDDYLVLRRGDLGGTIVARDDDSGDINDSLISETLPAGDYTIEATTFYMDGVEAEFTLEANAVDRVLYSGPALEKAATGYSPTDSTLDIRLLPTLPLPTLQITIRDDDGFGPGQPGAAEMLLQGRIESDVGSPGSVMLAVPNGVWVGHGNITVHTKAAAEGSSWEEHTAEDEQELLVEDNGGFFGFLKGLAKTISSLVGGSNPLDTIAGWLRILDGGQTTVQGEDAAMLELGASPVSQIFQGNHANCFSQVSVPWLVEEEEVTGVRISIPVILTDSEYVSVGAEFIARESGENEQSLVQAHDLLSTGQSLPACQRP